MVAYDSLKLTYLFIVGIAAQLIGIYGFWFVQKKFGLSTKVMFDAVMIGILLLDGWGLIGIWTQKFGFHNEWEFWLYQVVYGLLVSLEVSRHRSCTNAGRFVHGTRIAKP